jgi:transposase
MGSIAATALLAAAGKGQQFRKARYIAAGLGLVSQQYSTGGKTQMKGTIHVPIKRLRGRRRPA